MARKMTKAPSHAWRAVVTHRERNTGKTETEYLGPYWREQDAAGQVSTCRHANSQPWSHWEFVSGHIESAQLGKWEAQP